MASFADLCISGLRADAPVIPEPERRHSRYAAEPVHASREEYYRDAPRESRYKYRNSADRERGRRDSKPVEGYRSSRHGRDYVPAEQRDPADPINVARSMSGGGERRSTSSREHKDEVVPQQEHRGWRGW